MSDEFIPDMSDLVDIEDPKEPKVKILEKVPKGDKMALVRFDGTAITEQGNLVKHNWFKGINIDSAAYADIELTPTEARQLRTAHQRMKTGASAASIMTCFPASTGVLTDDRLLCPIEDLEVGISKVITHKGRAKLVTHKESREYSGAMFKFKYGDGRGRNWTPEATSEHPFYIKDKGWVKAADIKVGDFLLIPFTNKVMESSEKDLALATLLGYYLAEGSINRNTENSWAIFFSFHQKEVEYHNEVINCAEILNVKNPPKVYFRKDCLSANIVCRDKALAEKLISLGGELSNKKILSSEVFDWPLDMKRAMFIAYLNGDGHYRKASIASDGRKKSAEISWATVSKDLAEQLYLIAWMCGGIPSKYSDKPRVQKDKQPAYHAYMTSCSYENIFKNERNGKSTYEWDKEGVWIKITEISTRFYEGLVWNLGVEDDESFCAEWIAVHNCFGASVCPMALACPYVQLQDQLDRAGEKRGVVPLGKKCPVEVDIMTTALSNLAEEFDIMDGTASYTDQRIAFELAEIEVLEHRINTVMATDADLQGMTEEKLISSVVTREGGQQDNYVKDIADVMKIKEKLTTRKDKLRKDLVATRRENRIMNAREGEQIKDASYMQAELLRKFDQLSYEFKKRDD